MFRCVLLFVYIAVTCAADMEEIEGELDSIVITEPPLNTISSVEASIQKIEHIVASVDKISMKHADRMNEKIKDVLDEIIDSITFRNSADEFLDSRGIERVILPNIITTSPEVKRGILAILKVLFQIAHTTMESMPISLVDEILDVFENFDDINLKEMALDVLYFWLPNNPKLQARVMKLKGLEPFYQQMTKLNIKLNQKLLDLFNLIVKEHLAVRNNLSPELKADNGVKIYETIGLIERISTPLVCNGILNIFEIFTSNENIKSLQLPFIDLMETIKPFCYDVFKGRKKAISLFDGFHKTLSNDRVKTAFEEMGLNVTDIKVEIKAYVTKLKENIRSEL